jgi:hypothetical protein
MPKAGIINQATKLVATLKQQGHTVKALELYEDKIRVEFSTGDEDVEYNELDYVRWK